jgi:hypothetical protein
LQSITQPLSVGAAAAAPGYLADQKEIRNLSEARDKELTDIESLRRAEAKGNVKGAQDRIQKKMEKAERLDEKILGLQERAMESKNKIDIARSAIPKPTDMIMYARSYRDSARDKGDNKTPDSVLLSQGMSAYNKEKGLEALKYAGINQTAETAGKGQGDAAITNSVKSVDDLVKKATSPLGKEWRKASRLDRDNAEQNTKNGNNALPTNNAATVYDTAVRNAIARYRDNAKPNQSTNQSPAPAAAPAATRSASPPVAPRTTYTAADVEATAKKSGRSKQDVIDAYRDKGMELQK